MRRNVLSSDQNGTSPTPNSLDPDLSSYFLVRGRTNDSPNRSPSFATFRNGNTKSPMGRSQHTAKSADSNKTKQTRARGNSIGSTLSVSSKYRHIQEWNDKSSSGISGISPGALTPVAFESQRHPADPPRPPRAGLEWVWFPDGYWAERQVRDSPSSHNRRSLSRQTSLPRLKWWNKSPEKSKGASISTEADEKIAQKTNIPLIKIGSLVSRFSGRSASDAENVTRKEEEPSSGFNLGGFNFMKPNMDVSTSAQHPPALSLYRRTKKHIQERLLTLPKPQPVCYKLYIPKLFLAGC